MSLELLVSAEEELDRFVAANVHCDNCLHCTEVRLFDAFCSITDSISFGWNRRDDCCEMHDFRDSQLEQELEALQEAWHSAWLMQFRLECPELYAELYLEGEEAAQLKACAEGHNSSPV